MNIKPLVTAMITLPLLFATVVGQASQTQNLIVDSHFDFKIERDISINLTSTPQGNGVVNVYSGFDYYDPVNDIYFPDHSKRVMFFKTSAANQVKFQVNKNWSYLIVEYVSTDANGIDQYKKVDLTDADTISVGF